jgi:transcriptional regulatory protein RtcR
LQLAEVVRVCRASRSLAEAGRVLFNQSRQQKTSVNDSHRLKQYLQKFGLSFQDLN